MPNILLIMTDQQRGDCLSIEDHPVVLTPNMDSIAGSGVRFAKCYSTCPVCIPARRSLMSGQYPSSHGLSGNYNVEWDGRDSLPNALRRAGYHTYLAGRDMHQHPVRKRYGFDHMVVMTDYSRWLDTQVTVDTFHRGGVMGNYYTSGVMSNDWTARSWHLDEALHQTNWTTNEAMKFMQNRDPSCPYFLTVSYLAPHPPLVPPAFYMERYLRQQLPSPYIGDWAEPPDYDGKGFDVSAIRVNLRGELLQSCRAAYYASINHIDDQIRRLLHPSSGIDRDNTIVIFTSDHGEMLGDHYLWWKGVPYEGAARVPLLVSAPARFGLQQRLVVDRPVSLEDIMPTILDLVGFDIPTSVEGASLAPLMRGEEVAAWREFVHIEHGDGYLLDPLVHHSLTDGKEKYIWFAKTGREQLFDLADDPTECHDLSGDAAWAERLAEWRGRMIAELAGRPEGFSDGSQLIAGRPFPPFVKERVRGG
jgi:arylsulfatase A-like enzyme